MIRIPFAAAELLLAALWLLLRAAVWHRQKTVDGRREAALLLLYVNLAVILRFVFFPMARVSGRVQPLLFDAARVLPLRVNLIPFVHLSDFAFKQDLLLNLIGNVCLFVPSGILLPSLYKRLDRFWKVTGVGALFSLGVELLQLPFFTRTSDVDDLLLNTAGVAIGYGVYALVRGARRSGKAKKPGRADEGESPAARPDEKG